MRTLSTLKFKGFLGNTSTLASATTMDNLSSNPCCFELSVPLIRPAVAFTSRTSKTSLPGITSSCIHSNAFAAAFSYPSMISLGCNPSRTSSSANPNSSPPKLTTKFVPSPISLSCDCAAITINLAAGCATSNSRTITAASLVTNKRSKWLMTILFMPFGPRDVRVIFDNCLHASMFRITASSSPLRCLCPSYVRSFVRRSVSLTLGLRARDARFMIFHRHHCDASRRTLATSRHRQSIDRDRFDVARARRARASRDARVLIITPSHRHRGGR